MADAESSSSRRRFHRGPRRRYARTPAIGAPRCGERRGRCRARQGAHPAGQRPLRRGRRKVPKYIARGLLERIWRMRKAVERKWFSSEGFPMRHAAAEIFCAVRHAATGWTAKLLRMAAARHLWGEVGQSACRTSRPPIYYYPKREGNAEGRQAARVATREAGRSEAVKTSLRSPG